MLKCVIGYISCRNIVRIYTCMHCYSYSTTYSSAYLERSVGRGKGGQVTTGLGLWELCLKIFEIIGIIVLNSVEKLSIILLLFDSFK